MNDLSDRIARAMFDKLIEDDDAWVYAQGEDPSNITLDGQFNLYELADAVFVAIYQPTDAMLSAPSAVATDFREIWRAMLDAPGKSS